MLPDRREGALKRPPPFGFLKGLGLGLVVVLPTVAASVWALTRLGIGNPDVTMADALRMAAIFAGAPALLTAGGIGRLAAHASTRPGGRRTAVWRAARAQAVASAGLTIIALIPHGEVPVEPARWAWVAAGGAALGALAGAILGLVCGAPRTPVVPALGLRSPAIAELRRAAKAARRDGRDPRAAGRRALATEAARQAPARPGRPERAAREVAPRAATMDGDTPLPAPVPLGEDEPAAFEAAEPPGAGEAGGAGDGAGPRAEATEPHG